MSRRAPHRTAAAVVVAAALAIIGIALPTGAADASTRSPWDAIAQCESGGNWSIDTGNGYYGGLQFSPATWRAHGGRGSAASASRAEQIEIGRHVVATQGWEAWSGCSARLGLHGRSSAPDRRDDRRPGEHGRQTHHTSRQAPDDLTVRTAGEKRRAHHRGGTVKSKKIAPCAAKALTARYADDAPTTGARSLELELTNTGAHRCRLAGASRAARNTADRHDEGATATAEQVEVSAEQPHLVLAAHGGHAISRIPIGPAAGHGKRCRPARITIVRDGSDPSDASLDGLRLQTCADTEHEILSLGHPRTKRSTAHR